MDPFFVRSAATTHPSVVAWKRLQRIGLSPSPCYPTSLAPFVPFLLDRYKGPKLRLRQLSCLETALLASTGKGRSLVNCVVMAITSALPATSTHARSARCEFRSLCGPDPTISRRRVPGQRSLPSLLSSFAGRQHHGSIRSHFNHAQEFLFPLFPNLYKLVKSGILFFRARILSQAIYDREVLVGCIIVWIYFQRLQ